MVSLLKRMVFWLSMLVLGVALGVGAASLIDLTKQVKGTLPVANGGTGVTSAQGNGSKVQLSTGSTTTDNCVKFDANGNTVDSGGACGGSGGAPTNASYLLTQSNGSLPNGIVWLYPDNSPASPNALDDEFNAGSLSGSWTWANQGSCTTAESTGWLGITCPSNSSAHNIRYIWKSLPGTPWAFVTKITYNGTTTNGYWFSGLIAIESATNKSVTTAFDANNSGSPNFGVGGCAYTNLTTRNDCTGSTESNGPNNVAYFTTVYLKVSDDGTTITSAWSFDGVNYQTAATHTVATYFTTAPDRIGLFVNPYSQASVSGFDYFRRTL